MKKSALSLLDIKSFIINNLFILQIDTVEPPYYELKMSLKSCESIEYLKSNVYTKKNLTMSLSRSDYLIIQ